MLTHGNLLANITGATAVGKYSDQDVTLSWMPLTHDMGLIGFYLVQFANRAHVNLMPTDLFVRRPLLWLQLASNKRVTLTCSPNFGYRHFLKVLGNRRLENVDLSCIRSIYNGAEPISVQLCNEFMQALAYTGLKHHAMYPVYGLAEACLAVTFPELGSDYRWIRANRHKLRHRSDHRGEPGRTARCHRIDVRRTCRPEHRTAHRGRAAGPVAGEQVGHILIRGPSVTRGYFADPEATALAIGADGWVDTGDVGVLHEGDLYITGRSKEIIFINGQNYYPYDLENIAQRRRAWISTRSWPPALQNRAPRAKSWWCSSCIAAVSRNFCPPPPPSSRLINEHTGIEVAQVIPVKRIPKTTSGKVQRHLLERAHIEGEFDAELAALQKLRESHAGTHVTGSELEARLQSICESALPGKRVEVTDNLFEIGASSLKLIEIHENIDREFPGLIDLTELFDHPTIADLARHLEAKVKQSAAQRPGLSRPRPGSPSVGTVQGLLQPPASVRP